MDKIRYIITNNQNVFIFGERNSHAEIARSAFGKVTSAGFLVPTMRENGQIELKAHGGSLSLSIKSKDGDSKIINDFLRL
jgi:hypothetical protein